MGIETATAVPFPNPGITPTTYPSNTPNAIQEILFNVNGMQDIEKVFDDIKKVIGI